MIFRILWGVVVCWAAIVLCGIVYYGVRRFSEMANPTRNELLIGATISAYWIAPALLLALVLKFSPAARDVTAATSCMERGHFGSRHVGASCCRRRPLTSRCTRRRPMGVRW